VSPIDLAHFEAEALDTLLKFGAIDCISPDYDQTWTERGRIDAAAELLANWARSRQLAQFKVEVRKIGGLTPVLLVEIDATGPAKGTVVLYGHMDKQPPLGEWSAGLAPFVPVRRDDRVYARGLADDGYSLFSSMLALEDLEARNIPHARCVILIEASEESGSPHLEAYLDELSAELGDVDLLVCLDSGALTYDRLWITTSLRGNLIARVRATVMRQGQHSGSASGVVPSSFRLIRQLLDRLEDSATGRVLLPELHVVIPEEHILAADEVTIELGDIAAKDKPVVPGLQLMGASAAERLLQSTWEPTLSVTGASGLPDSSISGNVLRPYTELVVSVRLPPGVKSATAMEAFERTLIMDPPSNADISVEFSSAAEGWLMPPAPDWLKDAINEASISAFGRPAGYAGEGGSIPFLAVLQERYPAVQFVATGVLGPGSNAHGIDEMLDLPTVIGVTNSIATIIAAHAAAN
jgi:acetylornithine deacetylase/succinyl-diaminopimelate desuccinylase-like protein